MMQCNWLAQLAWNIIIIIIIITIIIIIVLA